jgi:DNA-binding transcriptional LysR family regulator
MMMSLQSNHLDAFMAVAELLNFTRAAEKLHITQSALSQRILNLEDELQTTLFIRDRAGLKLTEQAFDLVRYCQTRTSLETEFIDSLRSQNTNELSGVLRIGGFSSVMRSIIQPSIRKLLNDNPKLKLSLLTREMAELPDSLKRGEIDYMILDKRLEREELERVDLGSEHNVLVRSRKYLGPKIYLDHDEHDTTTADYFRITKAKFERIERRYLDDVYGLLDGVTDLLGMAVLPIHLISGRRDLEILNPKTVLKVPVSLYFYKKPFYPKLHSTLIEQLVSNARKLLAQNDRSL